MHCSFLPSAVSQENTSHAINSTGVCNQSCTENTVLGRKQQGIALNETLFRMQKRHFSIKYKIDAFFQSILKL